MGFLSQKPNAFGLDISDLSLKLTKVVKDNNSFRLVAFGDSRIPEGLIIKGEIKEEKPLASIIKKSLVKVKGKKIKAKEVICSLPEEKSFLDVIQIPELSEEQTEQVALQEVESHIPFPLSEVYFDYEKFQSGQKANYQEVLLAASPRKVVDPYVRVLQRAGLKVLAMEIESLAIVRALSKKDVFTKPVLVIDFGENRTSFVIFSENNARFTSTIPVSARQLTENIAQTLKIDFEKAEKKKISQGLKGDKKVFEAMTPSLTDLASQIKSHLDYYKSHGGVDKGKLEKVLLCGGGANLQGLDDFLCSELKVDVELGDPLININKEKDLNLKKAKALSLTTAIGLALRGAYVD